MSCKQTIKIITLTESQWKHYKINSLKACLHNDISDWFPLYFPKYTKKKKNCATESNSRKGTVKNVSRKLKHGLKQGLKLLSFYKSFCNLRGLYSQTRITSSHIQLTESDIPDRIDVNIFNCTVLYHESLCCRCTPAVT